MPKKRTTEEERSEASYMNGSERAWLTMLHECISHLGVKHPEAQSASYVLERQDAIIALRDLCAEFGDLDWPDELHLTDIIQKHLADHLRR